MLVLVTGSRCWTDRERVESALKTLAVAEKQRDPDVRLVLVHGDCPTGADAMADEIATELGWEIKKFPADWSQGKSGGPERNKRMVRWVAQQKQAGMGALGLAFIDAESRGTRHCLRQAESAGIVMVKFSDSA